MPLAKDEWIGSTVIEGDAFLLIAASIGLSLKPYKLILSAAIAEVEWLFGVVALFTCEKCAA